MLAICHGRRHLLSRHLRPIGHQRRTVGTRLRVAQREVHVYTVVSTKCELGSVAAHVLH